MNFPRMPRGGSRSRPAAGAAGSRSVVAAARETLALVLDEDAPPLDGDRDVEDIVLRLRGHLMRLGDIARDRPVPGIARALAAAHTAAGMPLPAGYMDARVYVRRLAAAVEDVVGRMAEAGVVCGHEVECPAAMDVDAQAAQVRFRCPESGYSLLCNGLLLFDDTGYLLPAGRAESSRRLRFLPRATPAGSAVGR
ncbi:DUF5999 family protein [Streptomyces sp. NPDC059247]|uniref:DUF5999 family protein n=1 Tax=Streptomyces sp. NPDC059247 TaxID=3346790 RepID=UPI0036A5C91E